MNSTTFEPKVDTVLSIVIASYNTRDRLQECLFSLYNSIHNISFEVIVSDNHSVDGSLEMVQELFPEVTLISNKINLGFSKANNIALSRSRGNYILLLNSDTIVLPSSINNMVDFLQKHDEVGALGAKLLYPDGTIQRTARQFPTYMTFLFGRNSILTKIFPNNRFSKRYMTYLHGYPKEPFEVDWVSGAALMVKRKAIEQVGLLDERFFMYWEDADWCFRIKQEGWKIFCIPSAPVVHYEGESSKNARLELIIQFHKSVFLLYRKHYVKSSFSLMIPVAAFCLILRTLVLCIFNLPCLLRSTKNGAETHLQSE